MIFGTEFDWEVSRKDLRQGIAARTILQARKNALCVVDGEERLQDVYKKVEGSDPCYFIHVRTAAGKTEEDDILTLRACWRARNRKFGKEWSVVWGDPKGYALDPRQGY